MYKKIQLFNFNPVFKGQLIPLKAFFALNESRDITPYDGTIFEVIVDGYVTDILITGWNMYQIDDTAEVMSLRELEKITPTAEIFWIWKK